MYGGRRSGRSDSVSMRQRFRLAARYAGDVASVLRSLVATADFDNPLAPAQLERRTGGSGGVGRHGSTDLRLLAHEAAHHRLLLDSLGLAGRPMAIWSGPPSSSARVAFRHLKAGETVDRWMIKRPLAAAGRRLITERLLRYTVGVSHLVGPGTLAFPESV